jgi:CRISPR/Cas system Type II protein with McrA/HNH and RuvC-like nuclease domain
MPAPTPGYVKNMIRRSVREIVEPSPTKKDEQKIWDFFGSGCAYCGKKLNKGYKEGHIDHLVSSSLGGSNHISNRVLSCANCNEKEKLDMPWEKFLTQKNPDKSIASRRKDKILKWLSMHKTVIIKKEILDEIESLSNEVVDFYDKNVKLARQLRNL